MNIHTFEIVMQLYNACIFRFILIYVVSDVQGVFFLLESDNITGDFISRVLNGFLNFYILRKTFFVDAHFKHIKKKMKVELGIPGFGCGE